jgi:hypothetical protein
MPLRPSPAFCLLIAVTCCAPAARAEIGKGHRILIEHGLQIQAQAFYVPQDLGTDRYTFDPKPYLDAGFTGINWHNRPLNTDFAAAHPKFPWGRWSTKPLDAELLPSELPYADRFVTFQYGDENPLNNPDIRAEFKSWFDAARPRFPGTILYTNQLAFDATDANLATYLRESKPDMLCMDSYRWKIGNAEGSWNLLSDMQRYRKWALGGHDGSGKRPIPYALFPHTFHGENMWRDPSESEMRLNHFGAWALGYTCTFAFTYNYGSTALFTAGDTSRPTASYQQLKEINRQGRHLGPSLVRLLSRGLLFVPGQHPGTDAKPVPNAVPIDMDAYPGGFNRVTGKDSHVRGVEGITNLGKANGGLPGDVILSWFQVLDESLDGEAHAGEWYFMVTNALVDPTGSAKDTRQQIQINFAEGTPATLQRLSRETGKVEDVPLPVIPETKGRRMLILELDGGTADLFKFKTGAPFVGIEQ